MATKILELPKGHIFIPFDTDESAQEAQLSLPAYCFDYKGGSGFLYKLDSEHINGCYPVYSF